VIHPFILEVVNREHLNDLRREAAAAHLADQVTHVFQAPGRRWPSIRWSFGLGRPALVRLSGERRHVAL
jgi:hypothetical protein